MDSISQLTPHTKLHLAESINKSERSLRSSPQPLNKQLRKFQALALCFLHISGWRLQRNFCVSGWSLPCPDLEAEDAEGRRVALELIPEFWACHPFSCSPRTAGGLFFWWKTQAQPGWLPGQEQEAATDLLLKAEEGSLQEFGQKCHRADVAAPIHVVGRSDFSQISVQMLW